jgi:putative peptidoglycan lipid II flippase
MTHPKSTQPARDPQGPSKPTHASLARSAGVIGGFTLVSRVLVFARDVLMARFFGTSLAAEAFVVSFKLPNLFRDLVGEGAMNAAIVPVLSETRALKSDDEFWKLVGSLCVWLVGVLAALTAFGVIFAPVVVGLVAPGFAADPGKFALTVNLTRLIFPFIFLIGFSAFMMGVLNTLKNFATSAMGPVLQNLAMIGALVWAVPRWGIEGMAWGVLIGGFLQCGIQAVSFTRIGFRWVRGSLLHPGVLKVMKLLGPRVWGSAVYQMSVFVDMIVASFTSIVGDGGQSALYYSSRLFQLPLAIFAVSLSQASLPDLSKHAAEKNNEAFSASLEFTVRNAIFTALPASVGLAVFAREIIEVLFRRGAFGDESVRVTSDALFYYSLGLVSCALIKVLVTGFYALQDTKTPVKTATMCLGINFILNMILMHPLKIGGLALSTSLAATANVCWLYWIMTRKLGPAHKTRPWGSIAKSCIAAAVMGGICYFGFRPWVQAGMAVAGHLGLIRLLLAVSGGALIYFAAALLLRSEEARNTSRFFYRKS